MNDKTVLIDYLPAQESPERTAGPPRRNARLFDLNGRQLAAFALESIDGGLGYQMLAKYIRQTQTYYLVDETNGQLGILPHGRPTAMRIVKLSQLTPFQAPQHPIEVQFSIDTESGTRGHFYVDTVTQKVRYYLLKPSS